MICVEQSYPLRPGGAQALWGRERPASSYVGHRYFEPLDEPGVYLWHVVRQGVCAAFLHNPHAASGGLNRIKCANGFA